MWICFNDGFISAVQNRSDKSGLVVRARRKEILQALFPGKEVIKGDPSGFYDYLYRVFVGKDELATGVSERIDEVGYPNFKDSVKERDLKGLYHAFWELHHDYQR